MTKPEVGDRAPGFTLISQEMKQVSLTDHRGRRVVLTFYPGTFTGVCRKESCILRDSITQMEELDAQVLGVSVNDPFSNKAFHEKNVLNFPLLSETPGWGPTTRS